MKMTRISGCVTTAAMSLAFGLLVPMAALAQDAGGPAVPPPPPGGQDGGLTQPADNAGGSGMMLPPGGPREQGQMRPGGPRGQDGMQPGGPRGQGAIPQAGQRGPGGVTAYDNQRAYLELVERFSKLSHDPETAAIAAVFSANELMRPKGDEAAIAYFNKLLPETKNEAVKRAIRLHLIDLYRAAHQPDKALAEVEQLIKDAPEK